MKEQLRLLIKENKIKEAFELLNSLSIDMEYQNDIILLQAKYNRLQKDIIVGVITYQDAQIENNRLTQSLLNFINTLPEKLTPKNGNGKDMSIEDITEQTIQHILSLLKKHIINQDVKLLWEKNIKTLFLSEKDFGTIVGLEENPDNARMQAKFEIKLEDALKGNPEFRYQLQDQLKIIAQNNAGINKSAEKNNINVSGNNNIIIQDVNGSSIIMKPR